MDKDTKTRSQVIAADVAALLRARNPLLWVVTREEGRVEGYLFGNGKRVTDRLSPSRVEALSEKRALANKQQVA